MSTLNEQQAAAQLLNGYAETLNKANLKAISSFYAIDGVFMPGGYKTLMKTELDTAGRSFLKSNVFNIKFDIKNIHIVDRFAFIDAFSETTTIHHSGNAIQQNSRDFFVLRKDGTEWKIYRYLFNTERN